MSESARIGPFCMWQKFKLLKYPIESHKSTKFRHEKESHSHDYTQIFYCIGGELIHTVDGVDYHCREGSMIIVPPGKTHGYRTVGNIVATHIQTNIVSDFFEDLSCREEIMAIAVLFLYEFRNELKFDGRVKYDFEGEEKVIADNVFYGISNFEWKNHVMTASRARILFRSLFSLSPFEMSDKSISAVSAFIKSKYIPILKTAYYMNVNFSRKITVDELTKQSNICRTDYFRYFKRLFGMTYSRYLSAIRVSHAMVLCKFSRYSFDYIANVCGFSDHAHMDVQFKKYYMRILPSALRRWRNINVAEYPWMILSRTETEQLPEFFYTYEE